MSSISICSYSDCNFFADSFFHVVDFLVCLSGCFHRVAGFPFQALVSFLSVSSDLHRVRCYQEASFHVSTLHSTLSEELDCGALWCFCSGICAPVGLDISPSFGGLPQSSLPLRAHSSTLGGSLCFFSLAFLWGHRLPASPHCTLIRCGFSEATPLSLSLFSSLGPTQAGPSLPPYLDAPTLRLRLELQSQHF